MSAQPISIDSWYLTILDSLDAVVYVSDMQNHELLFMNKMALKLAAEKIGGRCWEVLQKDQDGPCSFCTNNLLIDAQGRPRAPHVWEIKNTLNEQWWECHDQAIEWIDGRIVRLEIATNICRRKAVELEQKATENRYRQLFENNRSGVAVFAAVDDGDDFIFKDFNKAAEAIEQLDKQETTGRRVTEVFPRIKEFGLLDVFQRVWKTGQSEIHPVSAYEDGRIKGWRDNFVYKLPTGELVAIYEDQTDQKQTEQELHNKSESLRFALHGANSGMWDWDLTTGTIKFDQSYYTMAGYDPDDFDQKIEEWEKRIHPNDIEQARCHVQDIMTGRNDHISTEFRFKTKSGEWMWILGQGKIVEWDSQGCPTRAVGLHTDIDQLKQTEKKLRSSEERYRSFFENSLVGTFQSNSEGRFVEVNQAFATMIGYETPEQMMTEINDIATQLFIDPDDRKRYQKKLLKDRYAINFVNRFRHKEGRELAIMTNSRFVEKPQDNTHYYEGVVVDVTEKVKTERALKQSEENLQITLDSIGDAVISTDLDHCIVRMNPIAEQLTGWTEEMARGQRLTDVFRIINSRTKEPIENPVKVVLTTGNIVTLANHTLLISKNGTESHIADSAAPIRGRDGKITGAVLVFRDITEEYHIRDELQKLQQLESLGTLAGGIAHDFNNILSGIFGNIALARNQTEATHPCLKYLERAEISANRAKQLTNQLLTFAKGGEPIRDYISLGELIKEVAAFDLSGSKVKLNFSQPQDIWTADVDRGQIQQVISNLVINANQAMAGGGNLFIDLENYQQTGDHHLELKPGKYIQVTVRDEGSGIREDDFSNIFTPYFSTKKTGRGLGLPIVYSVIKRHEGVLQVNSESGEGTTFTFYLPAVHTRSLVATSQPEAADNSCQGRHILIMDDDEMIRILAAEMLNKLGCSSTAVTNGEETLRSYQRAMGCQQPYDLVIMDLTVPGGMGGKETIGKLLEIDPHARVIVSSGYADEAVMALYSDHGFKGVLAKPYSLAELQHAVMKALTTL